MRKVNLISMGVWVLFLATGATAVGADLPARGVPAAWTNPGTEWLVRVKRYSGSWALGYSDPEMAKRAQKPRVACEFHIRITVLER